MPTQESALVAVGDPIVKDFCARWSLRVSSALGVAFYEWKSSAMNANWVNLFTILSSQEEREPPAVTPAATPTRQTTGDTWLDGVYESLLMGTRIASKDAVTIGHKSGDLRLEWPKSAEFKRGCFRKLDVDSGLFAYGKDQEWNAITDTPKRRRLADLIRNYCRYEGNVAVELPKRAMTLKEQAEAIVSIRGLASPGPKSFRWNNIAIVYGKKWWNAQGVRFRVVLGETTSKDRIMLKEVPDGRWEAVPFSKACGKLCQSIRQELNALDSKQPAKKKVKMSRGQ